MTRISPKKKIIRVICVIRVKNNPCFMKKRALFIDRDGTLVIEPPVDYQLDSLEKLEFYPKVFRNLYFIRKNLDFEFVIVSNQDGLGTSSFPEETFWPAHNKMLKTFEGEGITFDDILIDPSFPEEHSPNRKPATGMLTAYMDGSYDLEHSFVIGDRLSDMQLAANLGAQGIWLHADDEVAAELLAQHPEVRPVLITPDWDRISEFLFAGERRASIRRTTKETDIAIDLNLDGEGRTDILTGLGFFDHMLEQIGRHSGMDLTIRVKGDLQVDELRLLSPDGRLPLQRRARLRRPALAGLGRRVPPRIRRRRPDRDVPPFLQEPERRGGDEPQHPRRGDERASQDRGRLQSLRAGGQDGYPPGCLSLSVAFDERSYLTPSPLRGTSPS